MTGRRRAHPTREPEKAFQGWVIDTAEALGWRVWHVHDSRRQVAPGVFVGDTRAAGLPDLVLVHRDPPRLLFVELKDRDGKVRPAQQVFLQAARGVEEAVTEAWGIAGAERDEHGYRHGPRPLRVFVWRPEHRPLIEAVLKGADA